MKLVLARILLAVVFPGLILANLQELAAKMPRCGVRTQIHVWYEGKLTCSAQLHDFIHCSV